MATAEAAGDRVDENGKRPGKAGEHGQGRDKRQRRANEGLEGGCKPGAFAPLAIEGGSLEFAVRVVAAVVVQAVEECAPVGHFGTNEAAVSSRITALRDVFCCCGFHETREDVQADPPGSKRPNAVGEESCGD